MNRSTVKSLCEKLAYIYFVIGVIGSFVLAYILGRKVDFVFSSGRISYDRDWIMTFAVFGGCFLSVLIVSAILLALTYTIETLENIEYKVGTLEDNTNLNTSEQRKPSGNEWKCLSCGRINASYVTTCVCGEPKER